jgi:hypothetical protein
MSVSGSDASRSGDDARPASGAAFGSGAEGDEDGEESLIAAGERVEENGDEKPSGEVIRLAR